MPAFTCHLFVCGNRRDPGHPRGCCADGGGEAVRDALKAELKRRGLGAEYRANQAGCLEQCEYGPALVLYPQGIWYGNVKVEDVPRIVEETVIGGRILPDLQIPAECLNTKGKMPWRRGDAGAASAENA